jgi:cytochrome P450
MLAVNFLYSTAVTWALFALTQNTTAQARLREELLTVSTDRPTMDQLNALPYLDHVVRETLRLYAPVPVTSAFPLTVILPVSVSILNPSFHCRPDGNAGRRHPA